MNCTLCGAPLEGAPEAGGFLLCPCGGALGAGPVHTFAEGPFFPIGSGRRARVVVGPAALLFGRVSKERDGRKICQAPRHHPICPRCRTPVPEVLVGGPGLHFCVCGETYFALFDRWWLWTLPGQGGTP